MEKILIISHESDIDGLGCVVLAKHAYANLDYILCGGYQQLKTKFKELVDLQVLDNYEHIYITDLPQEEEFLEFVALLPQKGRIQIIDHHAISEINQKRKGYEFLIASETVNGKKTCGTEMFFNYLKNNQLLNPTLAMEEFVELTRLEDTWDWKKDRQNGESAHDLAILNTCLNPSEYIENMYDKLLENFMYFALTKDEKLQIRLKKREYTQVLKDILYYLECFTDIKGNKYGAVFADYEYRNELAEYVRNHFQAKQLKYLIIVALNKMPFGQKSYRSLENGFDVNEISMLYNGGGHPEAAAVNITEYQRKRVKEMCQAKKGVEYIRENKREALKYICESKYDD